MVDSEYSTGDYKSSKISIKEVMKNPEMLKFVPDHLKTKQICNYVVKNLPLCKDMSLINIRLKKCLIKLF